MARAELKEKLDSVEGKVRAPEMLFQHSVKAVLCCILALWSLPELPGLASVRVIAQPARVPAT